MVLDRRRARHLVVVNLSGERADGMVRLDWDDPRADHGDDPRAGPSAAVVFDDLLSGERYVRDRSRLVEDGLYVALEGHAVHLLRTR